MKEISMASGIFRIQENYRFLTLEGNDDRFKGLWINGILP